MELKVITTGTEKQNAYAEYVRGELLSTIEGLLAETQAHPKCPEAYKAMTLEEYLAIDAGMLPALRKSLAVEDHRFYLDVVRNRTGSAAALMDLVNQPAVAEL